MPLSALQKHDISYFSGNAYLLGIDEAGRGCLAGPVVAGACVLPAIFFENSDALELTAKINDSKQLSASARAIQFEVIESLKAAGLIDFVVAEASVAEIDKYNILGASRLAMQRAAELLAKRASDWILPLPAVDVDSSVSPSSNKLQALLQNRYVTSVCKNWLNSTHCIAWRSTKAMEQSGIARRYLNTDHVLRTEHCF